MDREEELRERVNKIQDELNTIRQQKLIENRKNFVNKYFRTYIGDGENRYQYIYVDQMIDGNLYGWWFTIGPTFSHGYSIVPEESLVVNFVADDRFYSPYSKEYEEITKERFVLMLELIVGCVKEKRAWLDT